MWTKKTLKERFAFCKDRTIMLFTSYKAFGKVEGGPRTVMEAFAELAHTCLFPNFNFQSWTEGHYWDYYETPSKMGIITEFARKAYPRTFHPIYSFAVSGRDGKYWQKCTGAEAFGLSSPFHKFYQDEGLLVSVGLDDFTQTFTPVHYAEQRVGVDYRYEKDFHGIYRGMGSNPQIRTYSMYVRGDGVVNNPNPASRELIDKGIIKSDNLGDWKYIYNPASDSVVLYSEMRAYTDAIMEYARNEPHKLHDRIER